MKFEALKVGELAGRTGLTVRTLHHYDEIGVLKPSLHTEAGYRLYTAADVARLQQVLSLRRLGFSLEEVGDCLSRPGFAPLEVVRLHVARLREQIELQQELCERLEALAERFHTAKEVSAEEFLQAIEVMTMIEQYYTPEQVAQIEDRKAALGDERIKEANAEWPRLFAAVRAEMDAGTEPADAKVQALAREWYGLLDEFTGGDSGLFNSTRNMYANEDRIGEMDVKAMRPMFAYIQQAAAAAGIKHAGQ
jgi:DNA-binding transcriptional MerR regulator